MRSRSRLLLLALCAGGLALFGQAPQSAVDWTAAVLLALLFLSSGIWKITDVTG